MKAGVLMKDVCIQGNCGCGQSNCNCKSTTASFYWPAVIVAALVGVGLSFLFSLLSLAFGFSAFSTDAVGETVFNVGGFIGLTVLAILSMFLVGWIAGYLGRSFCVKRYYGELYGLTAWCLTLIFSILLAASSERLIAHTSYLVNKNVTPTAFTVAAERTVNKVTAIKNNLMTNTSHTVQEAKMDALAMTSFVTFFLFFIGALASCFGGKCALCCKKRCCELPKPSL